MSDETRRAVEAILMVADRPVDPHLLAQVTETPPAAMQELLAEMAAAYEAEGRGFVLVQVAGGYRFQSHPDLTAYVERFVLEGQSARLSSAALETLAIVAYKQPISRAQVASIRGVNVDGVVRTLEQRGYIAEIARDPGPGQAVLFGTTSTFLERLGLASLDELPAVAEFVPGADVVEALEAGLRVDAVTEGAAAPEGSGDDEPGVSGDVDLRLDDPG
jgi:segregation and condensation protein B